jgi:importin subunit alpha-1
MSSRIPEHRLNAFKNRSALRPDELRRRREDTAIEIRKVKREESLAKRRNLNLAHLPSDDESDDEHAPAIDTQLSQMLPEMIQNVFGSNVELQLDATMRFRKLLSRGEIFSAIGFNRYLYAIREKSTYRRGYPVRCDPQIRRVFDV